MLLSPLDNGISNEVSNFRPAWSEKAAKKRYLKADKNTFLSPFLSAYRKKEELQHVFIRLVEKQKERLNNKYFAGGVFMDLSKAFDCIPK